MPFDLADARAQLTAHTPLDTLEAYHRDNAVRMIDTAGLACTSRKHFPNQLTSGAWVIAADTKYVLLIHHIKSDRWFQPGGHIEPEDENLLAAAVREVREECGIDLRPIQPPRLFDIDMHAINRHKDEPDHVHFDCRFLFVVPTAAALTVTETSTAIKEARWVDITEARALMTVEPSNNRLFDKMATAL